jgi:spore maturation protein CgeB
MKVVVFGLSISSSWGNGHATLWRGLCRALGARGHTIVFFERDVPYYAAHRDFQAIAGLTLILYRDWVEIEALAREHLADAGAGMVTSYCPDALGATTLVLSSPAAIHVFYDMDTPVTLALAREGRKPAYVGARGFRDFDLVLSYAGGDVLRDLRETLGARRVAPLYGSVDPSIYRQVEPAPEYASDLSYLGTYAADRQPALETLFVETARRMPSRRFLIGGAQYPADFPWTSNIYFLQHLQPSEHPKFYCSSRLTLNVTRAPMVRTGFCPSGRLFEAAACGVPIVTDEWAGLPLFFEPGREIIVARGTGDVRAAIETPREDLQRIARAARERCLDCHTAGKRARELESLLEAAPDADPPLAEEAAAVSASPG